MGNNLFKKFSHLAECVAYAKRCVDAKRRRGIVRIVEVDLGKICQNRPVMLNLIQHLLISIESINIDRLRVEPAMTERFISMGEREQVSFAKQTDMNLSPFTSHFSREGKRVAFTLAEVLITLGIIGVVAALTLPSVIQKYKEKQTVTQVKKVYSILSQAFNRTVYDSGSNPADWGMGDMYDENSHIIMANKFVPYMKLLKNCVGQSSSYTKEYCSQRMYYSHQYAVVRLLDGTTVWFRVWDGNCKYNMGSTQQLKNACGSITVDLNADKLPNLAGQDIFSFYLTNYGIEPIGTQFERQLTVNDYCNKDLGWGVRYGSGSFTNGCACTAWILVNENMDYLHCSDLSWNGKKTCK